MLTYVMDVCWHALVIPCFKIVVIFRYNGGSSFVKLKYDFYRQKIDGRLLQKIVSI